MATCKDCLNEKDCPYRMGEAELISVNETVYENAEDLDKVNDVEALCQLFKDKNSYAEVKHGYNVQADTPSLFQCSVCGWSDNDTYTGDTATYNYCPNCSARMEGKDG